jgi:hypothetical protein
LILLIYMLIFIQEGLYKTMKDSVTGFREFVGAPDTPRWNSVLFGGMYKCVFDLSILRFWENVKP